MRYRRLLAPVVGGLLVLGVFGLPAQATISTSYVWVGASQDVHADNHSWTDSRNWSPVGVPGDGDSVSIAPPDGAHCVAHVDAVPSGVTLQNFSLSVGALCGASINGGSLTIDGQFSWDSGVIATPMTLAAGAEGDVSGFVTDNPRKELTTDFTVDGTLNMSGALVQIFDPHVLTISASGTLNSSGTSEFTLSACCVNPARVVVNGTLHVSDGTLTVDGVEIDQAHTISLDSGAVLLATAAPLTAVDGSSYTGAGRFQIWTGATARMTGTQSLGSGFHLELGNNGQGGSSLGGTPTFAGTGEFDWTGGTIMANLTIAHTVTMHVYGANTGNGRRILNGQDTSGGGSVPAAVVSRGTIVVDQSAAIGTSQSAHLTVASNGKLSLAPGTQVTSSGCCINPSTITNAGGMVAVPADSAHAGPAVLSGVAYQAVGGTTQIARGSELQMTGGPQSALGDTTVSGGGRLTVADPTTVSGTVTLAGTSTLALQYHGSLDGTAVVAGSGKITWQGGSLSGDVTLASAGGVTLSGPDHKVVGNVGGGSQPSTVEIDGPVKMAAGKAKAHNVLDIGTSTMTLTGATSVAKFVEINGGALVNTGDLAFDPGKKGSDFTDTNLNFTNQGTVLLKSGTLASSGTYSQAQGTTTLAAGTTFLAPFSSHPLTVGGGQLTGSGTVDGALLNNGGIVDPGSLLGQGPTGTLTVTGTYTQSAGGTLAIDIAADQRDVLAVQAAATVAGTLASHTMQGYSPKVGDTKTVLTAAGGLTWTVSCAITSGTGSNTGHWQPVPKATSLDVTWKAGKVTSC